jgi:hypothetical protein
MTFVRIWLPPNLLTVKFVDFWDQSFRPQFLVNVAFSIFGGVNFFRFSVQVEDEAQSLVP